jgi:hypothetical protein
MMVIRGTTRQTNSNGLLAVASVAAQALARSA